jgi:hypothetical protein
METGGIIVVWVEMVLKELVLEAGARMGDDGVRGEGCELWGF